MLKLKRIHADATVPTYGTDGAACFDFYSVNGGHIGPGEAVTFNTGWLVEVPEGYAMLIYSRSGHGFKTGLRLCNSVGVIDSDYRGEMMARLHNDGWAAVQFHAGERIAQGMLVPAPHTTVIVVDELSPTARGAGGFGSTGN